MLQVSGPPCSGKSTRLKELARQGWATMDDWEYHRSRGATSRDTITDHDWAAWYAALGSAVQRIGPPLAYIQGRPTPRYPFIRVQVLDPGIDECHRRADADHRPPITHQWVDHWYQRWGAQP